MPDLNISLIRKGTFHSLIIQGISIALVFFGNLLITRWAGAIAYGTYVHVMNWISILSIMALGGQEDIAIAEIPKYQAGDQPGKIWSLIRYSNLFVLLASLAITAVFLSLIYLFPVKTLHEYRKEFLIGSVIIYFSAFLTLNQSVLQALNYIRLSQLVEKWIKPFLLIAAIVAAFLFSVKLADKTLVGILVLVIAVCCIVLGWITVGKTKIFRPSTPLPHDKPTTGRPLRLKAFHFFSIDLLNLLGTKITMLVLPFFSFSKEVGIFNISYRFADLVIYPFFLMSSVMPQLFARHHASSVQEKQTLYSESATLMLGISLPLLLINVFAGKFFLGWFGSDFTQGYTGLIWLSLAQFLFSFFGPAHIILTMLDKEKYAVIALLVYVIALFLTNIILVPLWGMNGGTISVLISSLVYNTVLAVMAWRLCGVASPVILYLRRRVF